MIFFWLIFNNFDRLGIFFLDICQIHIFWNYCSYLVFNYRIGNSKRLGDWFYRISLSILCYLNDYWSYFNEFFLFRLRVFKKWSHVILVVTFHYQLFEILSDSKFFFWFIRCLRALRRWQGWRSLSRLICKLFTFGRYENVYLFLHFITLLSFKPFL